jgi:hypothetical protein
MAGTMHRIAVFVDCRTGNAIDMPVPGAMGTPEFAYLLEILEMQRQRCQDFVHLHIPGA